MARRIDIAPPRRTSVRRSSRRSVICLVTATALAACHGTAGRAANSSDVTPADRAAELRLDSTWGSFVDRSPHRDRRVLAGGVPIHVLDWGGPPGDTGPTMLLLHGWELNAHIYDDFAPLFTDRFRVVGMTIRGFSPSGAPEAGPGVYTIRRVLDDMRVVLDSVQSRQVILIGHSGSGAFLTAWTPALEAYERAHQLGETQSTLARRDFLLEPLNDEVGQMMHPPNFAALRVPALAVCALATPRTEFTWLTPDSARWGAARTFVERERRPQQVEQCTRFRETAPHGRTVSLDATHYVFITRQAEVVSAVRAFLLAQL